MKKKIGVIGVDAGLCWLGDPCYVFGGDADHKWNTWMDFVNSIKFTEHPTTQQYNYKMGHEGLGVLVSTGYGDGVYPVYAEIEDNRVKSVTIDFFSDADEDDDANMDEDQEEE